MKKLSKKEIENEIKSIFNKSNPTQEELKISRRLTKIYVKETKYITND